MKIWESLTYRKKYDNKMNVAGECGTRLNILHLSVILWT